jgi:hypothetical protein
MPLLGKGFLGLWHDIEAGEAEAEYHEWHTREHMPERVSLPGFLRARRGVDWNLAHQRYLTVYEGATLEAFRSPEYLERLNRPTAWSSKMAPHFRNFLRVACETVSTTGLGAGGAMATLRLDLPAGMDEPAFRDASAELTATLMPQPGVCGVHTALARPEYSSVRTTETELRPEMAEPGFGAVVLIDGVGQKELEARRDDFAAAAAALGATQARIDVYDIAFILSPDGGS